MLYSLSCRFELSMTAHAHKACRCMYSLVVHAGRLTAMNMALQSHLTCFTTYAPVEGCGPKHRMVLKGLEVFLGYNNCQKPNIDKKAKYVSQCKLKKTHPYCWLCLLSYALPWTKLA